METQSVQNTNSSNWNYSNSVKTAVKGHENALIVAGIAISMTAMVAYNPQLAQRAVAQLTNMMGAVYEISKQVICTLDGADDAIVSSFLNCDSIKV